MIGKEFCGWLMAATMLTAPALAQDDMMSLLEEKEEKADEKVQATFKSTKLINAQTIETVKERTLVFRITHRFDNISGGFHSAWGFDNATNIRFSLDYGITDRLLVGIGRSKVNEHIDGSLKFKLLEQTTHGVPLTIDWYSSMAFTPKKEDQLYAGVDSAWKVSNEKLAHRFSYVHQLIIGRKFSPSVSLEILPTYYHRNFAKKYLNAAAETVAFNDILGVGIAGRFKVTKRTAFVFDYFYTLNNSKRNSAATTYYAPLGLGVEIETGGHIFHINFTNSHGIIENDFLPDTYDTWENRDIKLGFNISRVFYF